MILFYKKGNSSQELQMDLLFKISANSGCTSWDRRRGSHRKSWVSKDHTVFSCNSEIQHFRYSCYLGPSRFNRLTVCKTVS